MNPGQFVLSAIASQHLSFSDGFGNTLPLQGNAGMICLTVGGTCRKSHQVVQNPGAS